MGIKKYALVVCFCAGVGLSVLGCGLGNTPSSEEVVQAFEDEGLEVRNAHSLEDDPDWGTGMVPKTEKEGTRFEIPSGEEDAPDDEPDLETIGEEDKLGDVFTYESREDLEVMKDYWENFNESGPGMFYTHVYDEGLVLVRIDGSVPKSEADEYGEVMEDL